MPDSESTGGETFLEAAESYRPCPQCGADCNLLGQGPGQCWGNVELWDYDEDGSELHVCRGHQNYFDWCCGVDSPKYIEENTTN